VADRRGVLASAGPTRGRVWGGREERTFPQRHLDRQGRRQLKEQLTLPGWANGPRGGEREVRCWLVEEIGGEKWGKKKGNDVGCSDWVGVGHATGKRES